MLKVEVFRILRAGKAMCFRRWNRRESIPSVTGLAKSTLIFMTFERIEAASADAWSSL